MTEFPVLFHFPPNPMVETGNHPSENLAPAVTNHAGRRFLDVRSNLSDYGRKER